MRDIDYDLQIGKKGVLTNKKSYLVHMLIQLFSTFFCILDQDILFLSHRLKGVEGMKYVTT